jgi:hypothetical protein
MTANVPSPAALAFHAQLHGMIRALPSFTTDRPGFDAGISRIKLAIVEAGGAVRDDWNGARIRVHGFSASSTTGVAGACTNWLQQVTLKAALAAMASTT